MKSPPKNTALLEIGVEELPARFIAPALDQIKILAEEGLRKEGLTYTELHVWGTPRRLTLFMKGLPLKAADRTEVAIGPPPKASKDASGNWTQAATGFAKSQKVAVKNLILEETAKGPRYVVHHAKKGQKTDAVLKELFPHIIQKINFPKNMIWEPTQFRFARPIRWLVSLFNSKVVRFKIAGVTADKNSYGLLSLGGIKISISKPERYKELLRGRCIIVDPADREKKILSQIESITKKVKSASKAIVTPEHLLEVIHLTEYPVGIRGQFEDEYLDLPREITVTVLRKHQKFFPLQSSSKKILSSFIGFRNGPTDHQEGVREGYERVTRARLADAQFFFDQDKQIDLRDLVPKLKGVGYLEELGTLWDKTQRVQTIAQNLAQALGVSSESKKLIEDAAPLAKADLLTQIVGELPELQGIAGRIYSELKGQKEVGKAIEQHYWPLTADGTLPKQQEAAVIAVADKLDTLVSHFAVGMIPSGSQDPFGLRRASIGIIRILINQEWNVSLNDLIKMTRAAFPQQFQSNQEVHNNLLGFFHQRILSWLKDQKYQSDEIEAVLADSNQSLFITLEKLKSLKSVRNRTEFESLSMAIKRARNILKQAASKGFPAKTLNGVDPNIMESTEKNLYSALSSAEPKIESALQSGEYQNAFLALAPLKGPIDQFFEDVMVMVEDETQRSLRLSLLLKVKTLFDSVADFSKLQSSKS